MGTTDTKGSGCICPTNPDQCQPSLLWRAFSVRGGSFVVIESQGGIRPEVVRQEPM